MVTATAMVTQVATAAGPNLTEFRERFPEVEVLEIMAAIDEGIPGLKERFREEACD